MRIGRGDFISSMIYASVPFHPPQIPYDLNWDQVLAAAVVNRLWPSEARYGLPLLFTQEDLPGNHTGR
jgi:hypothetical protein